MSERLASFTTMTTGRMVEVARAHLVVVPVDEVGPLLATGVIWLAGRPARIDDPVMPGDTVSIELADLPGTALVPEATALPVRYEDDDLVIVDKPAGMHVHPLGAFRTATALNALLHHAGARTDQPWAAWRPRPVHRLDRATTGLVAFAKHAEIHTAMIAMIDRIARRYRATVHGRLPRDAGTIDAPLGRDPDAPYRRAVVAGGQRAVTHYKVIERASDRTLVELELETGRTHQIRAHLASLGHPIVGDTLYAGGASSAAIELRAIALAFPHPRHGAAVDVRIE